MKSNDNTNVLTTMRALVPKRRLTYNEALRIAELQANKLIELFELTGPTVPSELVTELPRIEIRFDHDLPVSGSTHWQAGRWVITLNANEPLVRRRFSLMHEVKHVLDHTTKHYLYGDTTNDERAADHAEQAADHFAACLLMPKRWLKSQWFAGGQRLQPLARLLEVSPRALSIRLWHLGIAPETPRCSRNAWPQDRGVDTATYFRYNPFAGVSA